MYAVEMVAYLFVNPRKLLMSPRRNRVIPKVFIRSESIACANLKPDVELIIS